MKSIYKKILNHPSLLENPPVLIDVGASGWIHEFWKPLAQYSICIAFDADTRDFEITESDRSGYKKLIKINRIVSLEKSSKMKFYLTESPYCSSSLEPDLKSLEKWEFKNLFNINEEVELPTTTLNETLKTLNIDYIDWYKTDSQGTDLRLFKSIDEKIRKQILLSEFEPGILDAYKGEDKLHDVMAFMDKYPYWITRMTIKGSERIKKSYVNNLPYFVRRYIRKFLRTAPGWCEITYIKNFDKSSSERDLLLGWLISTIYNEHGNSLEISEIGFEKTGNILFLELKKYSKNQIKSSMGYLRVFKHLTKRVFKIK
jgi:hypothetical protein